MNIQLSDHFTYRRLIRFVIPSVALLYAPEYVPELSDCSGKAAAWLNCNDCRRGHEYGSGCAVHCGAWLGRGRCCGSNGIGAVCRRSGSLCLFCKEKQQQAFSCENKADGRRIISCLYEWLLRAGVECFHVSCGDAV